MSDHIKAIIFDFDGTLVNSVEAYLELFLKLGQRFGSNITADDFMRLNGHAVPDAIKILVREKKLKRRIIPYLLWNKKRLEREVHQQTKLYPNVIEMMTALAPHYTLAIATNNNRHNLNATFARYPLKKLIQTSVSQEDVKKRKPHPEIFLTAAKRLGLAPEQCLVVEDSPTGIIAAARAGMPSCAVRHTTPETFFKTSPTQFIEQIGALNQEFIETHFNPTHS